MRAPRAPGSNAWKSTMSGTKECESHKARNEKRKSPLLQHHEARFPIKSKEKIKIRAINDNIHAPAPLEKSF